MSRLWEIVLCLLLLGGFLLVAGEVMVGWREKQRQDEWAQKVFEEFQHWRR